MSYIYFVLPQAADTEPFSLQ